MIWDKWLTDQKHKQWLNLCSSRRHWSHEDPDPEQLDVEADEDVKPKREKKNNFQVYEMELLLQQLQKQIIMVTCQKEAERLRSF